MAHKRMFSKDITSSDAFREMPASSQALYFHLGMEADDDGFLDNYRGLMRSVNASEDDLRVLITKRFLILFPSKVVVIKHWRINNTIRLDRYTETKHLEEKAALIIKENGSYTDDLDSGNHMATQYRIEEKRIEDIGASRNEVQEVLEEEKPRRVKKDTSYYGIYELFGSPWPLDWRNNTTQITAAKNLLIEHGLVDCQEAMEFYQVHKTEEYCPKISTPLELSRKWQKLEDHVDRIKS